MWKAHQASAPGPVLSVNSATGTRGVHSQTAPPMNVRRHRKRRDVGLRRRRWGIHTRDRRPRSCRGRHNRDDPRSPLVSGKHLGAGARRVRLAAGCLVNDVVRDEQSATAARMPTVTLQSEVRVRRASAYAALRRQKRSVSWRSRSVICWAALAITTNSFVPKVEDVARELAGPLVPTYAPSQYALLHIGDKFKESKLHQPDDGRVGSRSTARRPRPPVLRRAGAAGSSRTSGMCST